MRQGRWKASVRGPLHRYLGARFPEGMKAFIAKLHAMGFKFGLYTDIGPEGCHHPFTGSYGYYAQDAATFKATPSRAPR